MNSRWLIISYFANVEALAPSHHIDDRLPFFELKGIKVHLLTSPCGQLNKNLNHKRILSPAPSGIRYETRYFLRRRTSRKFWFKFWETIVLLPVYPFYFLEKILLRLDSTWSWFLTASISAAVLAVKYRPDVIYSTGGPVSAHIAALISSRISKIPHIAEFQDPLVHEYAAPGKFERHFMKNVEKWIFNTAEAVIFLTDQASRNAIKRNNNSKKSFAIYAGAARQQQGKTYVKGELFRVIHSGSLGGSRHLGHVFRALKELFSNRPSLVNTFRLILYGNNSRAVTKQIEQFPFREVVTIMGKTGRQEVLSALDRGDLLLLILNTDDVSFETIPSKVYEYLHTGRPVLGLVYRNHELQNMLVRMGHKAVQADDEAAITAVLEEYITQWKENRLSSADIKSPYTVESAVEKLISLADDLRKDDGSI
jgi:hypothetical protein